MDAENAVSNLSSPPVVTSSPNTSEFEPQVQVVKHFVSEETRAKIDDAQTTPPIIHTNTSEIGRMGNTNDSTDVSSSPTDRLEEDITTAHDWDPLRSASQDSSTEKESRGVDLSQALEMEGGPQSHPANQDVPPGVEKGDNMLRTMSPVTATSHHASHLRPDPKSTLPSSRPWDNDASLNLITQRKLGYPESETASHRKFLPNSRPLLPKSSYYFGPPPEDSAYGTPPVGQIGVHYPREMVRIERDYSGGELPQFAAIYPLELEGRISPTQFLESINSINELLISAYSPWHALIDNALAIFSLQLSKLFFRTHYRKEMERLHEKIKDLNKVLFNPVGLNILWPRKVAFLFLEIEYY